MMKGSMRRMVSRIAGIPTYLIDSITVTMTFCYASSFHGWTAILQYLKRRGNFTRQIAGQQWLECLAGNLCIPGSTLGVNVLPGSCCTRTSLGIGRSTKNMVKCSTKNNIDQPTAHPSL